jgi:integrase
MVRKREHDEMDRKYLYRRSGAWHVRFRLPERFGGGLFQRSLGTSDITTARRFRDLYVMPFLAGEDLLDAVNTLLQKTIQLGQDQDMRFERLNSALEPDADDDEAKPSLRELVDRYMAYVQRGQVTPATLQSYSSHLEGFLRIVGEDRSAQTVTKQDITAYRDRLLALPLNWMRLTELPPPGQIKRTVSPAQVANALTYVRGFFSWIIDEGLVEPMLNPVQGIKAPFARAQKRRPFTHKEVEAACKLPMPANTTAFDEEAWRTLPLLARYTGARLGELAQLTGKDVVKVHKVQCIHVYEAEHEGRTTKTHAERYVPIASKIQPLMDDLLAKHGAGPLFPHCGTWTGKQFGVVKPAKFFGNAYQKAVKAIAPDLTFHSFRHYSISQMANAGVPEEVRMRIVGHVGRSVHAGYTRIDVETMAKAVETIF